MKQDQKIDFVVTWVDGTDVEWQRQRAHYLNPEVPLDQVDISDVRYRDWDNLRYWFRAVEKYAPWVNKVHLVTCGHVPEWLNLEAPKLNVVKHSDYMPSEYLPTFSSHPIELNFHRIEGLSEQFVLFCDDFFLTAPVKPTDFFVHGLPCDCIEEDPIAFSARYFAFNIRMNDIIFLNRHFVRRECRKKYPTKWYTLRAPHSSAKNLLLSFLRHQHFFGMAIHHLPQAYLKSTLKRVWELEPEWLDETCRHRFRDSHDISQCVFKFWQLMSGNFYPYDKRKFGRAFHIGAQTSDICRAIKEKKYKAICVNDFEGVDFEYEKATINAAFESVLPELSSFEK